MEDLCCEKSCVSVKCFVQLEISIHKSKTCLIKCQVEKCDRDRVETRECLLCVVVSVHRER